MSDEIQVQIRFTIDEEGYAPFTDAIYVPLKDYTKGKVDVEGLKAERWANQKAVLDAPAPEVIEAAPVEPSDAIAQARQALTDAVAALDAATAPSSE